jgi:predicted metal-dependent phosphotriesterase family hydrolase
MAHVQTVLGPVAPDEVGRILHHEHLLSLTPGPWLSGGRSGCCGCSDETRFAPQDTTHSNDQVQRAVEALGGVAELGIRTIVDLSPYGVVGRDALGDNVVLLQEIARRTGLNIVSGSSVYLQEFSPAWAVQADLSEMTARFIADATAGIGSTSVTAGIFGEQATGLGVITPHGTMALEQVEILKEEGADLRRVLIGHMDTHPDTDYVRQVVDTGVNIAFDTIGKQFWDFRVEPLPSEMPDGEFIKNAYFRSDRTRAQRIAQLVSEGYEDHIFLAQDLTGSEVYLNPATHGQWGYTYLASPFADLLREHGVTEGQLEKMLHANPARLLTIG